MREKAKKRKRLLKKRHFDAHDDNELPKPPRRNMFGGGGKDGDDGGGDVADEGDWYAALVAGEHVGDWLDIIKVRPRARWNERRGLAVLFFGRIFF